MVGKPPYNPNSRQTRTEYNELWPDPLSQKLGQDWIKRLLTAEMTHGDAMQLIKDVSENTYKADSLRRFESLAKHQLDVLKVNNFVC